ncbi:MAG: hypothetical protein Q9201_000586 [Fulgogasparrea decipioides]
MAQTKSKEAVDINSAAAYNTGAWGLGMNLAILAVLLLVMSSGGFPDLSCNLLGYLPILLLAAMFLAPAWYLVYRMLVILSDAATSIRGVRNGLPTTLHRDIQHLMLQIRKARKVRFSRLHSFNSSSQWLQQLPEPVRVEIAMSLEKQAAAEQEVKTKSNRQLVLRRITELEGNQKHNEHAEAQEEKAEANDQLYEEMLAECKEHDRRTQEALDDSREHCRQAEIRAAVAEAINLEKDKAAAEKDKFNDYLQNHNKSLKAAVHCQTKMMCGQKQEPKGCLTERHTPVAVPSNETTILESECESKITQLKAQHVAERDALERSHVDFQMAQKWSYDKELEIKEAELEQRYAAKLEADKQDLEQKFEKQVEAVTQSFRRREEEERRAAKAFFNKETEKDATANLAKLHDLEDQVTRLQQEKSDVETESKAREANLETTTSDQKGKITELTKDVTGLESKLAQAMQDLVEARADARKQTTEAGANATEVKRLKEEVRRLEEALRQANASNETLRSSQAEQSTHGEHLQREVSRLKQDIVDHDDVHHSEMADAQRKISDLETASRMANGALQKRQTEQTSHLQVAENRVATQATKISELESTIQEGDQEESQVEKEQREKSELAGQLDVAQDNTITPAPGLQEQLAEKTEENSVLQDKVKALAEELRKLKESAKASPPVSSNSTQTSDPAPSPAPSPCERLCIECGAHPRGLGNPTVFQGLSATASIATQIEALPATAPKPTLSAESVEAPADPQQNAPSTVTEADGTSAGEGASIPHDTSDQSETTAPAQQMLTLSATPVEKKPAKSTGEEITQKVRCKHCKNPIPTSERASHLKVCPEKKNAASAKFLTVKDATSQAKHSEIKETRECREPSSSVETVIQTRAAALSQPTSALANSSLGTQLSATQQTTSSLVAAAMQNLPSNAGSSTVEKTHEVSALASLKAETSQVEVSEQTQQTTVSSPIQGTIPPIQPSSPRDSSARPKARFESWVDELFEGPLPDDEEGDNLIDCSQSITSTAAADLVGQGTQGLPASFGQNAQVVRNPRPSHEPAEVSETMKQGSEQTKGESTHPKTPLASEALAPAILQAVTDTSVNCSDQSVHMAPALVSYEPSPEVNMQDRPVGMTLSLGLSAQPTISLAAQPSAVTDAAMALDEPVGSYSEPIGTAPASEVVEHLPNLMSTMALRDTTDDQPMQMDEPVSVMAPQSALSQSMAGNTAPAMLSTSATLTQSQDWLTASMFNVDGIVQGVEVSNPFLEPSEPSQDVDVVGLNPDFWQTLQVPSQAPAVSSLSAQAPGEETFRDPTVVQQIVQATPALTTNQSGLQLPSGSTLGTSLFCNPRPSGHLSADYLHPSPVPLQQTSTQGPATWFSPVPQVHFSQAEPTPTTEQLLPEMETGYQDDEPHDFYTHSPITTQQPVSEVGNPAHGVPERVAFDEESTEDGLDVCEEPPNVPRKYRSKVSLRARHVNVAAYPVANLEQYAPIPPSLAAQGSLQVVLTDEGQGEDTRRPQRARTDENGEFRPGQDRETQQLPLFNFPPDVALPGLNPWQEAAANHKRPEDGEAFNDPELFVPGHENILREERYDIWETTKAAKEAKANQSKAADEEAGYDGLWETALPAANDPANPFYTPGDHVMQAQIDRQVYEENLDFYGDDYMALPTAPTAATAPTNQALFTGKRSRDDNYDDSVSPLASATAPLRTTPLSPPQPSSSSAAESSQPSSPGERIPEADCQTESPYEQECTFGVPTAQVVADRQWKTDEHVAEDKLRAEIEGDRLYTHEEMAQMDKRAEEGARWIQQGFKECHDQLLAIDGECAQDNCRYCPGRDFPSESSEEE